MFKIRNANDGTWLEAFDESGPTFTPRWVKWTNDQEQGLNFGSATTERVRFLLLELRRMGSEPEMVRVPGPCRR